MITKTQLEQDIANADRAAQGTIYYAGLLADALNAAAAAIWTLPDERLEALLNHLGEARVQELLVAHVAIGAALNASLDAQEAGGSRVVLEQPRTFTVDEQGHITLVPLVTPEEPEE